MSEDSSQRPRAAAIDYGRARIGVAIADELNILAHPRPHVPAKPPQRAMRLLVQLLKSERIALVLVGLPRNMDGTEGLSARRARKFAQEIAQASGLPVKLVDERLTTVQAQGLLHAAGSTARTSKDKIDSASAAVMLQSWLDGRG